MKIIRDQCKQIKKIQRIQKTWKCHIQEQDTIYRNNQGGVPFEFKGIITMLHGVPQNQSLRWEICSNETEGKLSGERRKAGQGRAQKLPKTLVSVGYFSLVPLWKNLEYTLHHQTNPALKRGSSLFTPRQLVWGLSLERFVHRLQKRQLLLGQDKSLEKGCCDLLACTPATTG